jgi:hypothetical protein
LEFARDGECESVFGGWGKLGVLGSDNYNLDFGAIVWVS